MVGGMLECVSVSSGVELCHILHHPCWGNIFIPIMYTYMYTIKLNLPRSSWSISIVIFLLLWRICVWNFQHNYTKQYSGIHIHVVLYIHEVCICVIYYLLLCQGWTRGGIKPTIKIMFMLWSEYKIYIHLYTTWSGHINLSVEDAQ